jgi:hypothetical protein
MYRKWFSIVALMAAAVVLLSLSSCARNQHLTSISIEPSSIFFGAADPTLFANFKAFGTYVHPPQTKDITNQVTWQSDIPQVAQVTSAGVVSPNTNCGVANIFATFTDSGNVVVSSSSPITVDGPAALGCTPPGPQPILTISFAGTGTGTVTSTAGINCSSPNSCSNQFTVGTTINLNATPTGTSHFVNWSGCNSTSGTGGEICTVFLQNNLTVNATFNL